MNYDSSVMSHKLSTIQLIFFFFNNHNEQLYCIFTATLRSLKNSTTLQLNQAITLRSGRGGLHKLCGDRQGDHGRQSEIGQLHTTGTVRALVEQPEISAHLGSRRDRRGGHQDTGQPIRFAQGDHLVRYSEDQHHEDQTEGDVPGLPDAGECFSGC